MSAMTAAVMIWMAGMLPAYAEDIAIPELRFFESHVRPLLVKHCLKCHSGDEPEGSLRLDSRDGWQTGGDAGPAIVPGDPDQSLLMRAVRFDETVMGMPPTGMLPHSAVQILEQWIARGAHDSRAAHIELPAPSDRNAGLSHWSLQPIKDPVPPSIRESWSRTAIDRFVIRRQRKLGLRPAADADRATWLRRVTLDLTGLPPSTAEVYTFLEDHTDDAQRRVVDRLLNSTAFGEKWARHWLDLACYADTVGSSSMPMRHAWRYRDYVIGSFNADQPLDEFVRQQIAGDLLPAESPHHRRENLIATGFLAIGPWQLSEQDKGQLRMDVVDHQIARIGTMFLGMTLDCARCHDHKFDPIEQRDYYALAGVFANVDVLQGIWRSNLSGLVTVELPEFAAERRAREEATPRHTAALATARHEWQTARTSVRETENRLQSLAHDDPDRDDAVARVEAARKTASEAEADWRFLRFHTPARPRAHAVVQQDNITNLRVNLRGDAHALGAKVPRGTVNAIHPPIRSIQADSSGRLELVEWLFHAENPLTARVLANRTWAQLFGRGLVEPVDYFGIGGGDNRPSHPELLDFLARTLQRKHWSLKALIREIVLSRTYGLSTATSDPAKAMDPDNQWLWRANPRRLDAEMIRDGMLRVSGKLQISNGGPAVPLEQRATLRPGDLVNPPTIGGNFEVPEQIQFARSIYQPVIRSFVHKSLDVLALFDTPSPNEIVGERVTTTVPVQSLYLLNSPFVKDRAHDLAQHVMSENAAGTDEQRLEYLWMSVLNRPVTAEQLTRAMAFLDSTGNRQLAWSRLCHSLLVSNEFLFRR